MKITTKMARVQSKFNTAVDYQASNCIEVWMESWRTRTERESRLLPAKRAILPLNASPTSIIRELQRLEWIEANNVTRMP